MDNPQQLSTIRTTTFDCPVDLNALLYQLENPRPRQPLRRSDQIKTLAI